jgi:polysaccharide deacetylase family protein (PEP-CTERM system associated)
MKQELQSKRTLAISVDVEEYYHAANLSNVCPVKSWHEMPSRLEFSTRKILDIFDRTAQKGTFFVLAYSGKRFPAIVREIVDRGHELASHGYAHKIAYFQNKKQFFQDVKRSKLILEDISGKEVIGYRAPNFSIRDENIWAYDVLTELGFKYDSSLYPVMHDRYGNIHRSRSPETRKTNYGELKIFPLTVYQPFEVFPKFRVPIAGGAYWRLFPEIIIRNLLSKNLLNSDDPVICYLHPWEIDSNQPYFSSLSISKKLRHYYGIKTFEKKVESLIRNFKSIKIRDL